MMLDHCVSLLTTGRSIQQQKHFDETMQVYFKLQSGITTRRLDSLKTALMMIEVIKLTQRDLNRAQLIEQFDNFIFYILGRFPEPMAMAIVKYAIKDRKLVIKGISDCKSWKTVGALFKPVMLESSKDPVEIKRFDTFERFYAKLNKATPLSASMHEYIVHELPAIAELKEELQAA